MQLECQRKHSVKFVAYLRLGCTTSAHSCTRLTLQPTQRNPRATFAANAVWYGSRVDALTAIARNPSRRRGCSTVAQLDRRPARPSPSTTVAQHDRRPARRSDFAALSEDANRAKLAHIASHCTAAKRTAHYDHQPSGNFSHRHRPCAPSIVWKRAAKS